MAKSASTKPAPTTSEWIRRGRSKIHGGGLYAARPIPKGTRVLEYVGERVTKAEAWRREQHRLAEIERGGDGCVYVFEVNKRHDLDGAVSWNTARLANHSCDGNCETDIIRGRVWIIALRDIAAGEEITYDYGFDYSEWPRHRCRCGAKKCVGYIVHRKHRWRVRRMLERAKAKQQTAARSTAKKK
ncbi:MAG: SET domain-containing protein-lysine N-methyltransferase [Opitutaceae bacterium]|nr:SET domain-containing protein-lysine N-methyltransferase [Opitutaceae bacterium]